MRSTPCCSPLSSVIDLIQISDCDSVMKLSLFIVGFLSLSLSARAAVILEVDVSDASAVTFTATVANSAVDSSLNYSLKGITIVDFFTSNVNYGVNTTISGSLAPTLSSPSDGFYDYFGSYDWDGNTGSFGPSTDFNMYAGGAAGPGSQEFSTSFQAFTGVATFDFSANSGFLPTAGASGNIYTGYLKTGGDPTEGLIIGTWQVVPEPSSYALYLGIFSVACLVFRRRCRK